MAITSRQMKIVFDVLVDNNSITENIAGSLQERLNEASTYSNGTTDGKIDVAWSDRRGTPAASGNETIDLSGSLTDVVGTTVTLVTVNVIALRSRSTTSGDAIKWGPNSANGFLGPFLDASDRLKLGPGIAGKASWHILVDPVGWTVTPATGDLLYVEELGGANAANFDIIVVGQSA